jgi:hypothetical protein
MVLPMGTREASQPRRVPIAQARASLRDLVDGVNGAPERVKLTRYDKTIAGLVSARDLRLLEQCKQAMAERGGDQPRTRRPAKTTGKRRSKPAAK